MESKNIIVSRYMREMINILQQSLLPNKLAITRSRFIDEMVAIPVNSWWGRKTKNIF